MNALIPATAKRCTRCLSELPLSCFHKKRQRLDSQCKGCVSAKKKNRYAKSQEAHRHKSHALLPVVFAAGSPDIRLFAYRIVEAISEWQEQTR